MAKQNIFFCYVDVTISVNLLNENILVILVYQYAVFFAARKAFCGVNNILLIQCILLLQ